MLPVLLDLKFIKIYTFGVFLVLAFFWGSFILWKNIRLTPQKEDEIFDGLFFSLIGSLFFARFFYVILNFNKFGFNILKFILINGFPGLSLYGSLFGGILSLYIFFLVKKIDFVEVVDYFITPLFIVLAFGKLGSFFSGSEVGVKTNFFLSIKYVGYDGLRHLTPLYEAIFFCLGAYISYRLLFEVRKQKITRGFVFYFFCWYFALTYFLFDKIKTNSLYLIPIKSGQTSLSFNFMLSVLILLTFSFYFLYYFRNFIWAYGKPAYNKIRKKIGRSIAERSEEAAKADRRAKTE
ncbi:prolipoprotein diacylglyceryl transferase [Candidatus Roizmanbacteria bacterium]|nr:prolipoprotein diacylglyceryl transferase [Candidatus Roizmanbacteria bacterium]